MSSLISLATAQQKILDAICPITDTQNLVLSEVFGRTLRQDIVCPIDLPPFRSSAMDGYAFCNSGTRYKRVGTSFAGRPFEGVLAADECIRIFTGALLPATADRVIPQEDVGTEGNMVMLSGTSVAGANVRPAGLDRTAGTVLLADGTPLTPSRIGLLASAGINRISCTRPIKIALLATGDEFAGKNTPLAAGCVYESNLDMLAALLDPALCRIVRRLQVPDDRAQIVRVLHDMSLVADVIISSGGISVGDTDHVLSVLTEHGTTSFWRIALKPGMPMAFGSFKQAVFFGLPGNPVSTAVTFTELVAPCLVQMSGANPAPAVRLRATLQGSISKDTDRTEFQRGFLTCDAEGNAQVCSSGDQRSNRISSLAEANCYIILGAEDAGKQDGDLVLVQPFRTHNIAF